MIIPISLVVLHCIQYQSNAGCFIHHSLVPFFPNQRFWMLVGCYYLWSQCHRHHHHHWNCTESSITRCKPTDISFSAPKHAARLSGQDGSISPPGWKLLGLAILETQGLESGRVRGLCGSVHFINPLWTSSNFLRWCNDFRYFEQEPTEVNTGKKGFSGKGASALIFLDTRTGWYLLVAMYRKRSNLHSL